MKLLLVLFFSMLSILLVYGQVKSPAPDPRCSGVVDYNLCKPTADTTADKCGSNSTCSCKDQQPYCRCNSYTDEWFIGENCDQKWTTVTFALVASLPGLGLAIIVGVIVYCVRKPAKAKKDRGLRENMVATIHHQQEDDMFKNMVFASDMQERPHSRPPPESMRPPNVNVPMADRNYSQQRNIHPSQDRRFMGGPPTTSNSYGSGMGQVLSNPYANTSPGRPLYEGPSPSADYNHRPKQPPVNGMKVMASDFPRSAPPARPFPQPDYNPPNPQFQRPMMDGRY
ncbi:uncharacterized protein zgc:158432 [Clupea harengus]|uniref:Uncharacterized protein zgc:158432 n=1 Tax=Clupea harengus TaxID=7950 RepID=A0A6P8FUY9_CLUHA|nr:uncharacterized protein zgc:158432 [Clupea harengus]